MDWQSTFLAMVDDYFPSLGLHDRTTGLLHSSVWKPREWGSLEMVVRRLL